MKAFEDGKTIECRPNSGDYEWHIVEYEPTWNWDNNDYRIFSEPKKDGRWERKEIKQTNGIYQLVRSEQEIFVIDALPRIPGFGGIDYQSPFDEREIVRSMVPVAFKKNFSGQPVLSCLGENCRPGIPVAAWFWREE